MSEPDPIIESNGDKSWYKNEELHRDGDLPAVILANGTQQWYQNGQLHRDGDKPAIIGADGTQIWYKDGQKHRDGDLPAYIDADGTQIWYKNKQKHRDGDLPAYIDADGTQKWYKDGKLHRDGDNPAIVDEYGSQEWYKDEELHRDGDLPAVILANGTQQWYQNGQLHRDGDKPAIIHEDGSQEWYKDGKRHRDGDLPAYIGTDGTQMWYKNDKIHRDGDLPAYIGTDGTQEWYKDGKLHRDGDIPACIDADGSQSWYKDGKLHRDGDNPAIIYANGTQKWYKDGVQYTPSHPLPLININKQCFAITEGFDVPISKYLESSDAVICMILSKKSDGSLMSPDNAIIIGTTFSQLQITSATNKIYECKVFGTMRPENIITNVSYFNVKEVIGFADLVKIDDIAALTTSKFATQFIALIETDKHFESTVTDVMLGPNANAPSARHCQEGQGGVLYALHGATPICGPNELDKASAASSAASSAATSAASSPQIIIQIKDDIRISLPIVVESTTIQDVKQMILENQHIQDSATISNIRLLYSGRLLDNSALASSVPNGHVVNALISLPKIGGSKRKRITKRRRSIKQKRNTKRRRARK